MSTSGSVKFVGISLNRPTRSICLPQVDKTPEMVSQTIWLILGRTCLVPSAHYSTRSMRFKSLGLSEVVRRFQRVRLRDSTSTFSIPHLIAPHPSPPKKIAWALFSIVIPRRNGKQRLCKILGGQIRCISVGNVEVAYTSNALTEKAGETPYRD